VDETQQYSAAEMERMMKVQDVLLKAMAKKITWWEAAEIIGVSDRTMRRWRERLETDGYSGLADRRKGKPSAQRIPLATAEEVLRLYREEYFDLNMRHFHEKLQEEHGIELSYTWVQQALQGAGLVAKRHKRGPHRRRRPRRPMPGMLLHIDGSKHRWLNDDRWYDLIVILDDATSEIYYAQLVEEESTRTVMAGVWEVIENEGLFCSIYSDRGSHFFVTVREGEKVDKHRLTQFGRAMKEVGVQMIAAYSPQARGRSERSFGTWQGRLPQELRLAGITTVEGANKFLRETYIKEFNGKFSVPSAEKGTAFRRTNRSDLNWIFTIQTERVVGKDNTVAIGDRLWQIDKTRFRNTLAGSTVTIHEHLDGNVSIRFGPHVVGRFDSEGEKLIHPGSGKRGGKGGSMEAGENQKRVSTASHTPLEISPKARDSHFPTASTTAAVVSKRTAKAKATAKPKTKEAA
jgi:transposase